MIEANPEYIQAILDMQSLKSVKEVQKLTSCVVALGRFISKFADKCLPFFKTLEKPSFKWSSEAEGAFQQSKKYLTKLPKLVSPIVGETLFLYEAVLEY